MSIKLPRNWDSTHYLEEVGLPGSFPFVRGIHPTMYRGRLWTMRQYAGFGMAEQANARFRYLLKQGQSALSVAFDLPTQLGLDSDAALARGEVGRVGVAITSLADMQELFDGIALGPISTSMTINATAPILLALYAALAEKHTVPWEQLRGTVQNDILKEFIARGNYIYPPAPSLRLATDLIAFCEQALPLWYPISISGYHIREAGATAVQELAFTFANGLEYVRACMAAGLEVQKILPRLTFFFSVDNHFLEEIAKFRAARKLWAMLMMKHFGIKKDAAEALKVRFHAQTGGSTLTAQQPKNNIARVTLQALAAVLGGAQSLHTNAWDEALSLPSEASARLALRSQQIIAHESEVVNCVDPVGGAWDIEARTQALVDEAHGLIQQIDQLGGACRAVEQQFFQRSIAQSAYEQQRAVEAGEKVVVGVNRFIDQREQPAAQLWSADPKMEESQIKKLAAFKAGRSSSKVQEALDALAKSAADPQDNLMPLIIAAVRSHATLGEISQTMTKVFGTYQGDAQL